MKSTAKKFAQSILFQHLVFWAVLIFSVFLLFFGLGGFSMSLFSTIRIISIFITIFYIAVAVYINLFFLIPRFLKKKKYISFALLQILNIILFFLLNFFTSVLLEYKISVINYKWLLIEFIYEFVLISLFISITSFLKFLREWIDFQKDSIIFKETQRQKLEAELKLLRGQINPHFLFNTLNNLYALSLDKSDKTPNMILHLSDLMRYMLYECRDNTVLIENELNFIKNYLELEKVRIGEKGKIEMKIIGSAGSQQVSPLLFIPFIENAFKHGVNKQLENAFIKIQFDFEKHGWLKFTIENTKDNIEKAVDKTYSGIGIENVKKRLSLLYPNKSTLTITDNQNIFRVELIIEL
ncbi:MAG: histidine kinase [Bacteroidetes bacterium]|nr:histidine kinase [Bacteroidota bacterium]